MNVYSIIDTYQNGISIVVVYEIHTSHRPMLQIVAPGSVNYSNA
jgi:hypothetical protein